MDETLESKLAKLCGIISKRSTFPKMKKRRFFQNYTEEFDKLHEVLVTSKEHSNTSGSHKDSPAPALKTMQVVSNALRSKLSTYFHNLLKFFHKKLEDCWRQLKSLLGHCATTEKYAAHLKKEYLQGVPFPKWLPIEVKEFIKPIIVEKKSDHSIPIDQIPQSMSHHSIPIEQIFQSEEGSCMNRVLVEGVPGSGKSTLALELCIRWAKGLFQQFDLVVLLPLHDKRVKAAKTLLDLLSMYFHQKEDQEAIVKAISYNGGKGILLILEGFDKLPTTAKHDDTLISKIFANRELPNATVLVTTRPHASIPLLKYRDKNTRILQIVGFGDDEVEQYIRAAKLSTDKKSRLTGYLKVIPHIQKVVHNPLNCAILVQLHKGKDKKTSPLTTSTQLFTELVRIRLSQCSLCPKSDEYLQLCQMAYQEFVKDNNEFVLPKDFRHLDLMQASGDPFEGNVTFHFLHQSLQDYLAAYWIHTHYSPQEQLKLMKKKIRNPGRYENVLQFLAGLSNTIDWEDLAKHAFVDRQTLNVASFYLSSDIKGVLLPFLSWLFENQNPDTCAKLLGGGTIGLYSTYHTTPFDYYVLAYCIANSVCKWEIQVQLPMVDWLDTFSKGFQDATGRLRAIVALDVGHSQISAEGWEFLFNNSVDSLQSLQHLIFHNTKPPSMWLQKFPDHILKLKHLWCLALSKTHLGEGGAVGLMEALPKTKITELHLYHTGIGLLDCIVLAAYLCHPQCQLKSVDISYNDLTKESVNVFTSALIHNRSLTKLSMSRSTFSLESFNKLVSRLRGTPERTPITVLDLQCCTLPKGCIGQLCTIISNDENCALQSLRLESNPLELSDVKALALMLQTNCSLLFLYLKECSISSEGFTVLSASLHNNKTLCGLSLSGNEMSRESVIAICQGFFSEARFSCENILHIPVPPLLCLGSCPDEWRTTIMKNASECLQMYYFFQMAKANYLNEEELPNVKEFIEVTSNVEQKHKLCSQYLHLGKHEHDPSCGRDKIEEMWPGYIP